MYAGSNSKMKDEFKFAMMSEFEMKDLNVRQYFLAIEVDQSEDEFLFVRQSMQRIC